MQELPPWTRTWVLVIGVMIVIAIAVAVIQGRGSSDPPTREGEQSRAPLVVYRVRGSTTQDLGLSWTNETGGSEQMSVTSKAWEQEYLFASDGFARITVGNRNRDATRDDWVECELEVAGDVVDSERAYGDGGLVSCQASIR